MSNRHSDNSQLHNENNSSRYDKYRERDMYIRSTVRVELQDRQSEIGREREEERETCPWRKQVSHLHLSNASTERELYIIIKTQKCLELNNCTNAT